MAVKTSTKRVFRLQRDLTINGNDPEYTYIGPYFAEESDAILALRGHVYYADRLSYQHLLEVEGAGLFDKTEKVELFVRTNEFLAKCKARIGRDAYYKLDYIDRWALDIKDE